MVDFPRLSELARMLSALPVGSALSDISVSHIEELRSGLAALAEAERPEPAEGKRLFDQHLKQSFATALAQAGISGGRIAELGGAATSFLPEIAGYDVNFLSIFPSDDPRFVTADISNCPQVADATYDAVFSKSVLEHVRDVGSAAQEIRRILKPGGITMHAVPFSYFFHGAPQDYWRMTTTCLEKLFDGFEVIESRFYGARRRTNNHGSAACPVDRDGGPAFAADAFGGWRETWFTIYIGRKSEAVAAAGEAKAMRQFCLNLIKSLDERGVPLEEAVDRTLAIGHRVSFDALGKLLIDAAGRPAFSITRDDLRLLWEKRGARTLRVSAERFTAFEVLRAAGLA